MLTSNVTGNLYKIIDYINNICNKSRSSGLRQGPRGTRGSRPRRRAGHRKRKGEDSGTEPRGTVF